MEDTAILTHFNATLQTIVDFENTFHGGKFTLELVDIVAKYSSIMEGLFNITMATDEGVVGSGEMAPVPPLAPPPTSDNVSPSSPRPLSLSPFLPSNSSFPLCPSLYYIPHTFPTLYLRLTDINL